MKEVADILNVKGYGRNNLFKFLREQGILIFETMIIKKYKKFIKNIKNLVSNSNSKHSI